MERPQQPERFVDIVRSLTYGQIFSLTTLAMVVIGFFAFGPIVFARFLDVSTLPPETPGLTPGLNQLSQALMPLLSYIVPVFLLLVGAAGILARRRS